MPEMDGLEVQDRLRARIGLRSSSLRLTAACRPVLGRSRLGRSTSWRNRSTTRFCWITFRRPCYNVEQRRQGSAAEFGVRTARLTPGEKAVLDMLVAGKSLKEIAIVRNVTVQTIWKHGRNILQKMGVENNQELVRRATRSAYSPRP